MDRRRPWADLPVEILRLFLDRLFFADNARSAAVCTSWRSVAADRPHFRALNLPWLFVNISSDADESTTGGLFSPVEGRLHRLHLPGDCGTLCIGASHGWLIITENQSDSSSLMSGESKEKRSLSMEETPKKKAMVMSYNLHSSLKLGLVRGEEAAATGSNFVFSPLSILAALGLLAAAGMLEQNNMCSLLTLLGSSSLEDVNTASASLVHACCPSDDESVMKISLANGIWVKELRDFEPSDTVKSIFKTSVNRVDFKTKANELRTEINDWIEKETVGLIKDFLPQNIPNERTLYLLGNALYFRGNWERGVNSWETKVSNFRLHDTNSCQGALHDKRLL